MIQSKSKGMSRIAMSIEVTKVNPDGSEGESRIIENINSWVKPWAEILSTLFSTTHAAAGSTAGVLDTADVSQTVEALHVLASVGPRANSLINDNSFGLQVGTGATVVDRDDNKLVALIAEGIGAGQLTHQATTFSARVPITGGYRFTISRQVDNASGGTITVEEMGIVVEQRISGPAIGDFLIVRDLVTQIILDTESFIFRLHMDWIS